MNREDWRALAELYLTIVAFGAGTATIVFLLWLVGKGMGLE